MKSPYLCLLILASLLVKPLTGEAFTEAADLGFSPEATGLENAKALQAGVDKTGTILVSRPGIYKIAATVLIGSNTALVFGQGVFLQKVSEPGPFCQVLLNKGALTLRDDEHIRIEGLQLLVNGVDVPQSRADAQVPVLGLIGQVAFYHVKDLRIDRFRCLDLARGQFCLQVSNFEDLLIDDVIIKGEKDGIHLGPGRHFTIRNGVFQTFDDAIALNAHDYEGSNPELGWIEDGLVENCRDLNAEKTVGYFCRILAGAWIDWRSGMEVQKADTVVSGGRLYRVHAKPDGKIYQSLTQPVHLTGSQVIDGITWAMVQTNVTYTAGVRNLTFRDIYLEKPRPSFSIHFDSDKWSRSYYPGAQPPVQENLQFDNIRVRYKNPTEFIRVKTPVNVIQIANSHLRENTINFKDAGTTIASAKTTLNVVGCVFAHKGPFSFVNNAIPDKHVVLKTSGNVGLDETFAIKVSPGPGRIDYTPEFTPTPTNP